MALLFFALYFLAACKKHWENQENKWRLEITLKISLDRFVGMFRVPLFLSNGKGLGCSIKLNERHFKITQLDMGRLFDGDWYLTKVYVWRFGTK